MSKETLRWFGDLAGDLRKWFNNSPVGKSISSNMEKASNAISSGFTSLLDNISKLIDKIWNAIAKKVNWVSNMAGRGDVMEIRDIKSTEESSDIRAAEREQDKKDEIAQMNKPREERIQDLSNDYREFASKLTFGLVDDVETNDRQERMRKAVETSQSAEQEDVQTPEEEAKEAARLERQKVSVLAIKEQAEKDSAAKWGNKHYNRRTDISPTLNAIVDTNTESAIIRDEKLNNKSFIDYETINDSDYSSASTDFDSMRTRAHETFVEAQKTDEQMDTMTFGPRVDASIPEVIQENPMGGIGDMITSSVQNITSTNVSNNNTHYSHPMNADNNNRSFIRNMYMNQMREF
jgi:hypothetical protein